MKENSIEEDMKNINKGLYELADSYELYHASWAKRIFENIKEKLNHILSDYKRVLKENEELGQEKIDNQKMNLLAQNSMLDYQNGYEDGKANRRSAVQTIMDNQQYYIFQKQIEKHEKEIEKLQKENEELKGLIAHKNEYTKKLEEDLFENSNNYVIPVQKVKSKIEELKGRKMDIVMSPVHNNDEKIEILRKDKIKIEALQELLESEEK